MRLCLIKNRQFILTNSFYDLYSYESKGLQRIPSRQFRAPVKNLGQAGKLPAFVASEAGSEVTRACISILPYGF